MGMFGNMGITDSLVGDSMKKQVGKWAERRWKANFGKKSSKSEEAPVSGLVPTGEDAGAAMEKIIQTYLKYNPELSQQQFDLTSKYQPQYAALLQGLVSGERASDLADVGKLAPQLQGLRESGERSDVRAMREALYSQVLGDLQMGQGLTPEEDRNVTQGVRSAQMARGMGYGRTDANLEAVRRALQGRNVAGQRRAAASGVLAAESAQSPDPFATILGRGSPATSLAVQQTSAGNNTLTPASSMTNYWQQNSADQAAQRYNLTLQLAQRNPYLK